MADIEQWDGHALGKLIQRGSMTVREIMESVEVDASGWPPDTVAEQVMRLEAAGAQPQVTTMIRWLSTAERRRAAQDAADELHRRNLRSEGLKGANRSYAAKLR